MAGAFGQFCGEFANQIEIRAAAGSPAREQNRPRAAGHQVAQRLEHFAPRLDLPSGARSRRASRAGLETLLGLGREAGEHDLLRSAVRQRDPAFSCILAAAARLAAAATPPRRCPQSPGTSSSTIKLIEQRRDQRSPAPASGSGKTQRAAQRRLPALAAARRGPPSSPPNFRSLATIPVCCGRRSGRGFETASAAVGP